MQKTRFSLVLFNSHHKYGWFYGSENYPIGWPINRRYKKHQIFANLINFVLFCFLNETVPFWTSVPCKKKWETSYHQLIIIRRSLKGGQSSSKSENFISFLKMYHHISNHPSSKSLQGQVTRLIWRNPRHLASNGKNKNCKTQGWHEEIGHTLFSNL